VPHEWALTALGQAVQEMSVCALLSR